MAPLPSNLSPSPLFLPPHLVANASSINCFAVYGTLRDDDDSGAAWTAGFIAGMNSARSGVVRGLRLFHIAALNYPCAIVTNDASHHIHVRVLSYPAAAFAAKLRTADGIEYVRRKVSVELIAEDGGGKKQQAECSLKETVDAWLYVATRLEAFGEVLELPHGDWLRRSRG
jgi:gamma-glutamylcyclotransferase (GGCT)/AIG2-like uncharacterized protein YtfP